MTPTPTLHDRIPGLDVWRAGLLLLGILLHGSFGLPDSRLFTTIDVVSQTFRMGCFFAIAGALSAIAIARHGAGPWLRSRLVRLGIPLGFSMALFPPIIALLVSSWGWAAPRQPVLYDWYHLWFLVALTLYSLMLHLLLKWRIDDAVAIRLTRWASSGRSVVTIAILVTACASALFFAITPPIMAALLPSRLFETFHNLQLIAGYTPIFLFGVLAIRNPAFGARLMTQWRSAATIVAVVAGSYVGWFCLVDPTAPAARMPEIGALTANLRFIGAALCPPAAFVLILRSALTIRRVPPVLTRLAEASYTIYLLHLPIAAAINLPLQARGMDMHGTYAIAVVGSGLLSYLVHRACVRRSDVLQLLLNGRPPRRWRRAVPDTVPAACSTEQR